MLDYQLMENQHNSIDKIKITETKVRTEQSKSVEMYELYSISFELISLYNIDCTKAVQHLFLLEFVC